MRIDVSFKHLEKSPLLENVIDKNLKKVQRRVKFFKAEDVVHLSLHLEKKPSSRRLSLLDKCLYAAESIKMPEQKCYCAQSNE